MKFTRLADECGLHFSHNENVDIDGMFSITVAIPPAEFHVDLNSIFESSPVILNFYFDTGLSEALVHVLNFR